MLVVYALQLQDGCFHVGLTEDWVSLGNRLRYRLSGCGSSWSKIHHPVALAEAVLGDKMLEKTNTISLMKTKGWAKVGGGNYTQVNMMCPKWWKLENVDSTG